MVIMLHSWQGYTENMNMSAAQIKDYIDVVAIAAKGQAEKLGHGVSYCCNGGSTCQLVNVCSPIST